MYEKVLDLFDKMPFKPDEVIITIVFNACAKLANAHAIQRGREILQQVPRVFYDNPILVNSTISMLMKFKDVADAEHLFKSMKNKSTTSYGTMMNGKRKENIIILNESSVVDRRLRPEWFIRESIGFIRNDSI